MAKGKGSFFFPNLRKHPGWWAFFLLLLLPLSYHLWHIDDDFECALRRQLQRSDVVTQEVGSVEKIVAVRKINVSASDKTPGYREYWFSIEGGKGAKRFVVRTKQIGGLTYYAFMQIGEVLFYEPKWLPYEVVKGG